MSGHPDRLAGVAVMSAVLTGIPTVGVGGVDPTLLARGAGGAIGLADSPVSGGGAVVAAADAAAAAAHLDSWHLAAPDRRIGLVWVLWDGHGARAVRRAATRAGLVEVASFRSVGSSSSPTHLVRDGRGHVVRWFAASARPRWGARSRLARLGNHLPGIGHRFFDGRAVLFRAAGGTALTWPGAEAASAPAVLHLGGGATAGRVVLTWADGSRTPTHHTKLAPEHLTCDVVAEAEALTVLAGIPAVTGTVPTLLGLRREETWSALSASHLPGRPHRASTLAPPLRRVVQRVLASPSDVDSIVTAWLAALSRASQGWSEPMAIAGGTATERADRLALAVASLDDVALQAVVRRGLALGATCTGLLHGDLWPGNVHLVGAAGGGVPLAVLDWESALVGHPLVDLITWLVSSVGRGEEVRERAVDALRGPTPHHHEGTAGQHVTTLLSTVGPPVEPAEVEALVLSQMVVIAVEGGPAGGDGVHERAWLDAVHDVWDSWQRAGGSPWSSRLEVPR